MRKITLCFILIVLSIGGFAQDERHFILWNTNSGYIDLSPKIFMEVNEKIHYNYSLNQLDMTFATVTLGHKIKSWFNVAGAIRMVRYRGGADWFNENRFMAFYQINKSIKRFEINHIGRMAYRILNPDPNNFRHFQNLTIQLPYLLKSKIRPFIGGEMFTQLNKTGLHLARTFVGIKAIDMKRFNMTLYYGYERTKKDSQWRSNDILGTNLNFAI